MKKYAFVLISALCLLLAGCGARSDASAARSRTVFAMDTVMNLTVYGGNEDTLRGAEEELHRLDDALARTREGSDVYTLNHSGSVRSIDAARLFARADEIAAATDGAFDVTIAPVLALWGFGENADGQHVPDAGAIAEALRYVGREHVSRGSDGVEVRLDLPAQVDFGGIAKGYAAMQLSNIFSSTITGAVLDLGGDVCVIGKKPDGADWRIAVKDPADGERFLGVLEASDVCVMTSGVYERYFEENGVRYHHIIDPQTGWPADNGIVSATVICRDGIWADALATALCVLGAESAETLRQSLAETMPFDYILVTDGNAVRYTCAGFTPEKTGPYSYEQVS